MKIHEYYNYEEVAKAFHMSTVPSIIFRQGKYIRILNDMGVSVNHIQVDHRKFKRQLRKSCHL